MIFLLKPGPASALALCRFGRPAKHQGSTYVTRLWLASDMLPNMKTAIHYENHSLLGCICVCTPLFKQQCKLVQQVLHEGQNVHCCAPLVSTNYHCHVWNQLLELGTVKSLSGKNNFYPTSVLPLLEDFVLMLVVSYQWSVSPKLPVIMTTAPWTWQCDLPSSSEPVHLKHQRRSVRHQHQAWKKLSGQCPGSRNLKIEYNFMMFVEVLPLFALLWFYPIQQRIHPEQPPKKKNMTSTWHSNQIQSAWVESWGDTIMEIPMMELVGSNTGNTGNSQVLFVDSRNVM